MAGGAIDVTFLIKTSTNDATHRAIVQKRATNSTGNGWSVGLVSGAIRFELKVAGVSVFSFDRGSIADGAWHLVKCCYSGNTSPNEARTYIDGSQSGAAVTGLTTNNAATACECRLGAFNDGGGKLTATLASDRTVDARVVATDEDNDLALVKIEANGLEPVNWRKDDSAPGEWVATQGLAAVPDAVGIISGIPRKILPARALIGVRFGLNEGESTRVDSLAPGSGAEQAGIRPGDVILSVNGQAMKTRTELVAAVREFPAGRVVRLQLQRGDEVVDVSVTLTAQTVVDAAEAAARGGPARGAGGNAGAPGPNGVRGGRGGRGGRANFVGSGVSKRAEDFDLVLQHDTVLEPWECGGPLLDLYGRAVGLNIARAGREASYALPAVLVQKLVTELRAEAK